MFWQLNNTKTEKTARISHNLLFTKKLQFSLECLNKIWFYEINKQVIAVVFVYILQIFSNFSVKKKKKKEKWQRSIKITRKNETSFKPARFFSVKNWFASFCNSPISRGGAAAFTHIQWTFRKLKPAHSYFHSLPPGSSCASLFFVPSSSAPCRRNIHHHNSIMSNVADTRLYDILGVSPSATESELKKVVTRKQLDRLWHS